MDLMDLADLSTSTHFTLGLFNEVGLAQREKTVNMMGDLSLIWRKFWKIVHGRGSVKSQVASEDRKSVPDVIGAAERRINLYLLSRGIGQKVGQSKMRLLPDGKSRISVRTRSFDGKSGRKPEPSQGRLVAPCHGRSRSLHTPAQLAIDWI
ncbi:MAG: hypothetical protein Q9181_003176 [Wetmoreana brouardii]